MKTNKNSYLFEEMRPGQLAHIINQNKPCYLPLGTLEWHERHLPFGVDAITSYEICKRACRKTGGCVIPPLYFGTDTIYEEKGREYRGMNVQAKKVLPGSIYTLDEDLFYILIKQIIKNIYLQGFRKLVLVSGHCEPAQMKVVNRIYDEGFKDMQIIAFPRKGIFFEGSLDHAGEIETRLIQAIRPDLVKLSKLSQPYVAVIGEDPRKARKKEGEKQLKEIVKQLTQMIDESYQIHE